jgi:hypothetical protein
MTGVTKTLSTSIMHLSQFTGAAQVISLFPQPPPKKKHYPEIYVHMQPTAKGDLKDTEERKHIANKQRNIIG